MLSNAVNPGWVPARMGGVGASDDLQMDHQTQTWLPVSDDPAAKTSGGYWYHRNNKSPPPRFKTRSSKIGSWIGSQLTGIRLF